jgi:hypothetical protein
VRQEGSRIWVYTDAHEGDEIPRIAAIGCELRLEEAFAKVLLGEENADLR